MNWMSFLIGALEQHLRLTLEGKTPDDTMKKAHEWGQQFAKWLNQKV